MFPRLTEAAHAPVEPSLSEGKIEFPLTGGDGQWSEVPVSNHRAATCAFLLDYEEDEDEEEPTDRQRKKPWRYRWPDEFRDEFLARLLVLNKQRAEEEKLSGAVAEAKEQKFSKPQKSKRPNGQESSLASFDRRKW